MSATFKDALITGGAINLAQRDIHFHGNEQSTTKEGIDRLFSNVAPEGFHNSGHLIDPPKCHPNTRLVIIQEILDWLDDQESSELVMWLHGAAGAGKSAIAGSITEILLKQKRLSGSFFFTRGSATAGDERRLVPTLAYQVAKYLPEARFHIATTVVNDPAIFSLSLHPQVQDLLIHPLWLASDSACSPSTTVPRLLIIDGLDECRNADVQSRILQIFAAAVKSMPPHLPHKLLIASRPEIHLSVSFNEPNINALCRRLPLDNSYNPDHDIELFLRDKFSKIKGEHHMRTYLPDLWPPEDTIQAFVRKSSGQFIYASTVVKYIASARHSPAESLKIISRLKPAGRNEKPFAALDSVYSYIFNNVDDIELVLCILRIELADSFAPIPYPENNPELFRKILGKTVEELEGALTDLVSIMAFDRAKGWFKFLHASIPDFLLDQHRSRTFYIDLPKVNLERAKCCINAICNSVFDSIRCTLKRRLQC